ncbi:fasciclin domain-containing protein, partial [Enterobacter hormaechei]|uniref:fasciclin domain-containing protein n=1 Tax=Enterobacter hormaechei TaxID=158836 RepID=UPI0029D92099
GGAVFETLEGNTIEIGCDGESLVINGVKLVNRKDIVTSNGVIHLIDEVIIPDSAKQVMELTGPDQTTFKDLLVQLGLAAYLRP